MNRGAAFQRAGVMLLLAVLQIGTSPAHTGMVVRFDGSDGVRLTIDPPAELTSVIFEHIDPATGAQVEGEPWRITGLGVVGSLKYGEVPDGFVETVSAPPLVPGGIYMITIHTSDAERRRTQRWNALLDFVVTQGGLIVDCRGFGWWTDDPRCHPVRQFYREQNPPAKQRSLGLPAPLEGK